MFNRVRIELALRLRQQATLPKSISTLEILQTTNRLSRIASNRWLAIKKTNNAQ
jgi:hypothetical protein